MPLKMSRKPFVLVVLISLILTAYAAERTEIKPGWNLFSAKQDVEIGREVAQEAEQELPILTNSGASAYIDALGKRLSAKAPGESYPYQFKIVNDQQINAFALPGGFIYINRGIIENADNEAQLAGVMAHEIAHVALRHGTNQVSKAYIAQVPLSILGGLAGTDSVGGVLTRLGISFAANSILLKYSRDAERQADLLGTQILYDNGYDPRAMAQFFEKIQNQNGRQAPEFLSSHPDPGNRITGVNQEIANMGGLPPRPRTDSAEFREAKRIASAAPLPAQYRNRNNMRR